MKKKSIKEMCRIWADMTECNNHGGALLSVAEYFGLGALADRFRDINARHEKIGYMRFDLFTERLGVEKDLFSEIRKLYGESVYNSVYNSL